MRVSGIDSNLLDYYRKKQREPYVKPKSNSNGNSKSFKEHLDTYKK